MRTGKCIVDGCLRSDIRGRGYCSMHYERNRKFGSPGDAQGKTSKGSLIERIMDKVSVDHNGCWIWMGHLNRFGYGTYNFAKYYSEKKSILVHRWVWEYFKEPIKDELTVDHLCRVHNCVNPEHMEIVTKGENTLRGNAFTAINARKTHCPSGHEYTKENTLRANKNARRCAICTRKRAREAARRHREQKRQAIDIT